MWPGWCIQPGPARIGTREATSALITWLQLTDAEAASFAFETSRRSQFPEIWQAALDPDVNFHREANRAAIRNGLAERAASYRSGP